ncbi:transmembrane protein 184C-like [Paramacrobiotus metropolitanus]|uniref:transmembrane protein 184C-like n=1 Tax=Paramacrobiotus metropolitanus TaxID=2943436 RepID=UPI002445C8A4|nr:transmembrane protein 184C-like [Paramacrobiotus metropolitanus]
MSAEELPADPSSRTPLHRSPSWTGPTAREICTKWRSWLEPLVFTVYVILLIVALPLCVLVFKHEETNLRTRTWFIGGIFVFLSVPVSLHTLVQHLIHYTKPSLQRHIIRILWMPTIYAASAWFSLRFPSGAIYFDTFRSCYEAYVIYNFMRFLLNYLEERCDIVYALELKPQQCHFVPVRFVLPSWAMGYNFLTNCKLGVLQYTVVMPVITATAFVCESLNVYNEGTFDFTSAWSYLVVLANLSQIWAMYCLILFYQACKEELAPMRPLSKFLCVKLIVFASFWQSIVIAIVVNVGLAKGQSAIPETDIKSVSTGLQDILICGEMVLASIAHHFAFSYVPYIDLAAPQVPCCTSFWAMMDVRDVTSDMVEHAKVVGTQIRGGRPAYTPRSQDERTRLIDPASRAPSVSSSQNDFEVLQPPQTGEVEVRRPRLDDEVFQEPIPTTRHDERSDLLA